MVCFCNDIAGCAGLRRWRGGVQHCYYFEPIRHCDLPMLVDGTYARCKRHDKRQLSRRNPAHIEKTTIRQNSGDWITFTKTIFLEQRDAISSETELKS